MFSHAFKFSSVNIQIAPLIFAQFVLLSDLSVLIGQSTLGFLATGDMLYGLTRLCCQQSVCKRHR